MHAVSPFGHRWTRHIKRRRPSPYTHRCPLSSPAMEDSRVEPHSCPRTPHIEAGPLTSTNEGAAGVAGYGKSCVVGVGADGIASPFARNLGTVVISHPAAQSWFVSVDQRPSARANASCVAASASAARNRRCGPRPYQILRHGVARQGRSNRRARPWLC